MDRKWLTAVHCLLRMDENLSVVVDVFVSNVRVVWMWRANMNSEAARLYWHACSALQICNDTQQYLPIKILSKCLFKFKVKHSFNVLFQEYPSGSSAVKRSWRLSRLTHSYTIIYKNKVSILQTTLFKLKIMKMRSKEVGLTQLTLSLRRVLLLMFFSSFYRTCLGFER